MSVASSALIDVCLVSVKGHAKRFPDACRRAIKIVVDSNARAEAEAALVGWTFIVFIATDRLPTALQRPRRPSSRAWILTTTTHRHDSDPHHIRGVTSYMSGPRPENQACGCRRCSRREGTAAGPHRSRFDIVTQLYSHMNRCCRAMGGTRPLSRHYRPLQRCFVLNLLTICCESYGRLQGNFSALHLCARWKGQLSSRKPVRSQYAATIACSIPARLACARFEARPTRRVADLHSWPHSRYWQRDRRHHLRPFPWRPHIQAYGGHLHLSCDSSRAVLSTPKTTSTTT